MFPDGRFGAALLLLRVAAGAVLLTQAAGYLGDKSEPGFLILAVVAVISAVGVLLLIGFLTRIVALLAAMVGVSSVLFSFPGVNSGPWWLQ